MTYDEVLEQVLALLQRDKRVAYRVLKRRFSLDDEYVEDLKADLIDAKRLAADEDEKVLVWTGGEDGKENGERRNEEAASLASPLHSPVTYTPQHLAERIRAEQAAME